ncbi:MAG: 6,7-dimethyl-8-ribityllumazine synthase [Bacteroidales bacterium]|nr:6,7-dimethyl-8-ribityllumazine synthase [Bacteroidales bacterium]
MSTILNTNGEALQIPRVNKADFRCAVITAEWNSEITHALRDGAVSALREGGVRDENIELVKVPGTVELVYGASCLMKECRDLDAIIVIGVVIRGDTPHFDYVCQQAAQGVASLNTLGEVPVIFGVLTVDNVQQALDRAGGCLGNKGSEAAVAAIEMGNLTLRYRR